MTDRELLREQRGAVLVLTLNRPDARNAVSAAMMRGVAAAVDDAERDDDIRVIIVTGAGDRAFSAGMDLRAFGEADVAVPAPESFLRLLAGDVTVPVVAAVNGVAVGAGFELALGADVVVASTEASFGFPEVKRGMFAGSGVMHVGKRLPLGIALELALTGERIDATRAYGLGFVNTVVAPEAVLGAALAVAETIARNAPLGLAATKELVRKAAYGAPDAEARLAEWQQVVFTSEDAREGALAFVEKRDPVWRGQ